MVLIMNMERNQLMKIMTPVIEQEGCGLVDLKIKGSHYAPLIQVFIDRDSGITIDNCTKVSKKLSELLDITFPDIRQYRLEVSSPGTERPLKTEHDFLKNLGRNVKIQIKQNNGEKTLIGKVVGADLNKVTIESGDDKVDISYTSISSARIQLPW
jgi:ribosome maturation factor RimP